MSEYSIFIVVVFTTIVHPTHRFRFLKDIDRVFSLPANLDFSLS